MVSHSLFRTTAILGLLCPAIAQADIVDINPGDVVSITATLNTTDPNENGEGEPIVITADGATIGVDPNYAIPGTFTYTAPPVITAPGSPIPKVAINYYIQGYDGDESASFSTTVNPPPTVKTAAQISAWNNDAFYLGLIGGGVASIGAVGCPFSGPYIVLCNSATGAIGGLSAMAAAYFAKLAADPVDSNYTVIATPKNIQLPANLTVGTNLASDESKAIALAAALITSFNRYQGAMAAGDSYWAAQQLATVISYSNQLNRLIDNLPSDLRAFANQLIALGVPANLLVSTSSVFNTESQIASYGLSPEALNLFNLLGLSSGDIQTATQDLYVQNINDLAGQYPALLNTFAANLQAPGSMVPEPGSLSLFAASLAALLFARRRRAAALFIGLLPQRLQGGQTLVQPC